MKAIGRILGRLVAVTVGYVVACIAAGAAIAGGIVFGAWLTDGIAVPAGHLAAESVFVGGVLASFAAVYAFAPAVVAIVAAEIFRIRRAAYHVLCGGLAGALGYVAARPAGMDLLAATEPAFGRNLVTFVAAGLIGGAVYWLVAGRGSGATMRPAA